MTHPRDHGPGSHARLAGFAYLAIILSSIVSLAFVESRLIVEGDPATTTENIMASLSLFRIGLAHGLVMFAGVVVLAWALYVVLRTVNERLALLALLFRMAEAVLGGVTVLAGALIVLLLDGGERLDALEAAQVQALVGLLLDAQAIGFDIVIFFLCLGTIVFCWLFYRSGYIPRLLAGFGILAFGVMMVAALSKILLPQFADLASISYGPGILFELAIGLWLLVRGVDLRAAERRLVVADLAA